jgi:hypothetical protein
MNLLWKFLVWLDYAINYTLLRGRWESMSSRTYRNHKKIAFCEWLMNRLDSIEDNHCENMYLKDKGNNPFIPTVPWQIPLK